MIAYTKPTMAVVTGAMILLLITIVNQQPFFFPDTTNYVRGPDAAVVRMFGPRFATLWTDTAVINAVVPNFAESISAAGSQITKRVAPSSEPSVASKPQVKHINSLEDGVILSGRSVYYGALLYIGAITGAFWLSVLAQAAVISYVLFVLIVRCFGFAFNIFLISIAGLGSLSTLPFFVGFLMPDIFAGVTILVTAIFIAFWAELKPLERIVLALILVFSVLTHLSHLLICTSVLAAYTILAAWHSFWNGLFRVAPIVTIVACALSGVVGEIAFSLVVSRVLGFPPIRPPFVTARLIELGPGYEYLKARCRNDSFAICGFQGQLPVRTESFLWSYEPAVGVFAPASVEMKRALSDEQFIFGAKVMEFDPVGVVSAMLRAGLEQLTTFALKEFPYYNFGNFGDILPAEYWNKMQETIAFRYGWVIDIFSKINYVVVILSCLVLIAGTSIYFFRAASKYRLPQYSEDKLSPILFFTALGIGIISNALICGSFSSIHDRYQARVIWLIPLAATLVLARILRPKRTLLSDTNALMVSLPGIFKSIPK